MSGHYFLGIMVINFVMLAFGYLGEVGLMNRRLAQLGGFVFFFLLYGIIYFTFLHHAYNFDNQMIFWAFVFSGRYMVYFMIWMKKVKMDIMYWTYFLNVL